MIIKSITNYFRQSLEELEKVTWPTKNQAIRLTIITFVFCLVVAFIVGAVDYGLNEAYQYLIDLAL